MLSVAALGDAGAGDVVLRDQQFAQASAPNGSCMPIGVTAAGELVFPWECREVIERERGPVSLDLSMPPKTSVSSQTVSSQTVSSQSVSSQIVSTPSLPNPAAGEPTVGKTAAAGDGAKKQPSAQGTEPEHVATIPGAAAPPSAAGPTFEPMERHPQVKRLASSRRQLDPRGTIRPAIPPGTPQPASPPRTRSLPPG
jgi:hypothetical protein